MSPDYGTSRGKAELEKENQYVYTQRMDILAKGVLVLKAKENFWLAWQTAKTAEGGFEKVD